MARLEEYGTHAPVVNVARPLRADARRNRERVLAAAEAAFSELGASVPLDEIARRAGVGPGTVYRHFPTKERLFEAVVLDRLQRLAEAAAAHAAAPDPAQAFFVFLARMLEEATSSRALKDALAGPDFAAHVADSPARRELGEALAVLLGRAQRAGAVRRDVAIADLMALLAGAALAAATPSDAADGGTGRLALVHGVLCDGLRPPRREASRDRARPGS